MEDRLVRTNNDKILGGVCGGLGHYFGIDSTIIRLFFAIGLLFGLSPLVYIILWIIMPSDKRQPVAPSNNATSQQQSLPDMQRYDPYTGRSNQDPTGEWRYDPYTGEPIRRDESTR